VPKNKRTATVAGTSIQLNTMHLRPLPCMKRRQFTAIDDMYRFFAVG